MMGGRWDARIGRRRGAGDECRLAEGLLRNFSELANVIRNGALGYIRPDRRAVRKLLRAAPIFSVRKSLLEGLRAIAYQNDIPLDGFDFLKLQPGKYVERPLQLDERAVGE